MDLARRVAVAALEAERVRAVVVEGGEVLEVQGLVLTLTNLPAPELNGVRVAEEPDDPPRALASAERLFRERGHRSFGIEIEVGRHPQIERAIRAAGLQRVEEWPAMAAAIAGLPHASPPAGVTIAPVTDDAGLEAVRSVEVDTFGTPPNVAERFVGPGMLADERVRMFTASSDGEAVGEASAYVTERAVGIFGVGVLERARRRGVGTALTLAAARAFGEGPGIAWLQPSPMAERLYGRLGFRTVSRWEVWART